MSSGGISRDRRPLVVKPSDDVAPNTKKSQPWYPRSFDQTPTTIVKHVPAYLRALATAEQQSGHN